MLSLETIKYFADEFAKIAMDMDAGARATAAGKLGLARNYLPGGELPANTPTETNFAPKLAFSDDNREKAREMYNQHRGTAAAALKGTTGGVAMGALLHGGSLTGHHLRGFAALGAGLGLADHYITKSPQSPMAKAANFISSSFTPARQLSESVQTGSFKNMVHDMGGRLKPPHIGQKFTVPSTPT